MRQRVSRIAAVCVCFLSLGALLGAQACNRAPATSEDSQRSSLVSHAAVEKALSSGELKFGVRGLRNEATLNSYGVSYLHRAVIVAVGQAPYTKGTYFVLFTVTRTAGGDPISLRDGEQTVTAVVRNGIGDFVVGGGFKSSSENWDPERIRLDMIGVIPALSLTGSVTEQ
jgi:hypothetical protein